VGTPQEVTERIVALAEHGDANTVQIGFNRGAMRQEMFFGTDPPLHPRRAADRAGTPGEPRTGSRGDQGALTGSRKDNNNGEAFSGAYAATGADPDAIGDAAPGRGARQSGRCAILRRLCAADDHALDHVFGQHAQPVPDRRLAAHGIAPRGLSPADAVLASSPTVPDAA
jgi:hypothetical protein